MVETDVHYPTNINLLFDAIRKVITPMAVLCRDMGLSDWRQHGHKLRVAKRLFRKAQPIKRSTSRDDKKKVQGAVLIKEAHQRYLAVVSAPLDKAEKTIQNVRAPSFCRLAEGLRLEIILNEVEKYIARSTLHEVHCTWKTPNGSDRASCYPGREDSTRGESLFDI